MLYCQQCKHLVKSTRSEDGQTGAVFHCQECGTVIPIRDGVLPGTVIAGFEIIREIGRGAMGIVYEARQINLERLVAVKILSEEIACDEAYVQRFFREARSAASLSHPNIVQAYDAGVTDDGIYYFVMELIHGENLNQILNRDGRVSFHKAITYFLPIAGALSNAWSRNTLSHGDIKPENIIIQPDGKAKLADFGLARRSKDKEIENEDLRATPAYAPPEIVQWKKGIPGFKSDMYSFGATMYHVLTGREPFPGDDPQLVCNMQISEKQISAYKLVPGIPEEISQLIDELMEKDPEKRPESWEEVEERLEDMLLQNMEEKQCEAEPRKRSITVTRTSLVVALLFVLVLVGLSMKFVLEFAETTVVEKNTPSMAVTVDKNLESSKAKWSILKSKFPNGEPTLADLQLFVKETGEAAPEEAVNMLRILEEKKVQAETLRKSNDLSDESNFLSERNALLDEASFFIAGEYDEEYDIKSLIELQSSVLQRFAMLKNVSAKQKERLLTPAQKAQIQTYLEAVGDMLDELKNAEKKTDATTNIQTKSVEDNAEHVSSGNQSGITGQSVEQGASGESSDEKTSTHQKKNRKSIQVITRDENGNTVIKTTYVENEDSDETVIPAMSLTEQIWQNEIQQLPSIVGTSVNLAEKRIDEVDSLQNIMKLSDFPDEKRILGNLIIRFIQFSQNDLLPYIVSSKKILKGQELFRNTNPGSQLDEIIGKEIRMKYMDKSTNAVLTQKLKWDVVKKNEREERIAMNLVRMSVFSKLTEEFREILFTKLIMSGVSIDSTINLFEQSSGLSQEKLNRLKMIAGLFRKIEKQNDLLQKNPASVEPQVPENVKKEPLLKNGMRTREQVEAQREERLLERARREAQRTSDSRRTKRNISHRVDTDEE